jgi:hypothetical protein
MKILLLSGVLLIASCSNENEKPARDDGTADKSPVTDAKPAPSYDGTVAKPGAPFQISYDARDIDPGSTDDSAGLPYSRRHVDDAA